MIAKLMLTALLSSTPAHPTAELPLPEVLEFVQYGGDYARPLPQCYPNCSTDAYYQPYPPSQSYAQSRGYFTVPSRGMYRSRFEEQYGYRRPKVYDRYDYR